MDIQQEVQQLEKELLELIIKKLEENKMEVEEARRLAADFLKLLPIQDQKDLLMKLKLLSEEHKDAQGLYVEELSKASEIDREQALTQMRNAIHAGNIEQAIAFAKHRQTQVANETNSGNTGQQ